jgi:hypothetical protein
VRQRLGPHLAILGVLAAAAAAVAVVWLANDSRRYAATNSTAPRAFAISPLEAGHALCVTDLWMPAGSDAVRVRLTTQGEDETRLALSLLTPEGTRRATARVHAPRGQDVDFPIRPLARGAPVRLCLRTRRALAGVSGTPELVDRLTGPVSTVDGAPTSHRVSVWFLEPRERSLASALPAAVRRATLFRAGFVGPWTYVALLALLPLLWLLGLGAMQAGRR